MSLSCLRRLVLVAMVAVLAQAPLWGWQSPPAGQAADPHLVEEQAAERQALGFLEYLDHGRYADSYAYTGMLIRSQLDRDAFAAQIANARNGTGALQAREMMDASYTTSLPSAPEGEYVVLHYRAGFAIKQEAVETVTLQFAKGYWRVVGYYIQ